MEAFVCRVVQDQPLPNQAEPVAVLLDGRLNQLTVPITWDVQARNVDTSQRDGGRIYRRSLTLLLLAAVHRTFPDAIISVDHVLDFGAYYCVVENRPPSPRTNWTPSRPKCRPWSTADLPITKEPVPLEEAQAHFEENGDRSKVELLAHRRKDELAFYTLDGITNYFHGYMVPSFGYLPWFGLAPYSVGFVLRFPRRDARGSCSRSTTTPSLAPSFKNIPSGCAASTCATWDP